MSTKRDSERGSASAFFAAVVPALILMVGIVTDGGAQLAAIDHAQASAEQAARIAAQDITGSVQAGQRPVLAATSAVEAGQQALTVQDVTGTVTVAAETVTVTATATRPTVFLSLIGINSVTGSGEATARLVLGTTTEVP